VPQIAEPVAQDVAARNVGLAVGQHRQPVADAPRPQGHRTRGVHAADAAVHAHVEVAHAIHRDPVAGVIVQRGEGLDRPARDEHVRGIRLRSHKSLCAHQRHGDDGTSGKTALEVHLRPSLVLRAAPAGRIPGPCVRGGAPARVDHTPERLLGHQTVVAVSVLIASGVTRGTGRHAPVARVPTRCGRGESARDVPGAVRAVVHPSK